MAANPYAFPGGATHPGMTLRDWFAGQALAGMCADHTCNIGSFSDFAQASYEFADAMLANREGK